MLKMKTTNSGSDPASSPYNNITAPYVSFQNNFEDEDDDHSQPEPMISSEGDIELAANWANGPRKETNSVETSSQLSFQPKRVRLRALESERDYFLKLMNINILRALVITQISASLVILICQVILYAIPTDYHKFFDYIGMGIWGPVLFFVPTCWLTYVTMRSPSGCSVGSALACQIISVVVGLMLIVLSIIYLTEHGSYSRWRRGPNSEEWDHEVALRVFTSFMVLAAVIVTATSMITSIQYCRLTCCGKSNANERLLYDVEIIKV